MDYHYLISFIVTGIALLIIVSLAIAIAKAFSQSSVIGGIVGFAIFLLTILFIGMGTLDTPLTNWVSEGLGGITGITAVQTAANSPAVNNVSVQVDVPEQVPPTIIVQGNNDVPISTPEVVSEPISEVVIPDSDSGILFSDRAEMFDLGSQIDGYFSDGAPYELYVVKSGDTVYSIKEEYGIPEGELTRRNEIDIRRYRIFAGDILKIPIINGE